MSAPVPGLGVVIAARNAAATIGAAVASALVDPLVTEVLVVDDGSTDGTAAAAASAAGGDNRLMVLRNPTNLGPAAARNRGLEHSRASAVAILDADDRLLPSRWTTLAAAQDWDLVADNIVFVADPEAPLPRALMDVPAKFETISPKAFVEGNISQSGRPRGELGFLQPVISRAFLERWSLRYDPALRLGEDYDFYVRALLVGGRFLVTRKPGYLAVVRGDSLSAQHATTDLAALAAAARRHLVGATADPALVVAMQRLLRQVETRYAHRALLDRKRQAGVSTAISELLRRPDLTLGVARAVLRDKLARQSSPPALPRLLLPVAHSI